MKTQALLQDLEFPSEVKTVETVKVSSHKDGVVVKPFMKWAGGKSRLLPQILPHIPADFSGYHEPFLGSGAVFFAVRNRASNQCHLSDLNSELINTWQIVRDEPADLLAEIQRYRGHDAEEDYYAVRAESPTGSLQRAARFIYLNQTAWNGLWRENKNGVFNVPWGARAFRGLDPEALDAVSNAIGDVAIEQIDFRESLEKAKRGDFVYLDPPYLPISDTSKFSGYNGKRFRLADLIELAELCESLTDRGVRWVMSNRDNPTMRELFSHARVIPFTTWRSVSAQNRKNIEPSASPEVIVVGGRS
jgi:DNA adenine methylase